MATTSRAASIWVLMMSISLTSLSSSWTTIVTSSLPCSWHMDSISRLSMATRLSLLCNLMASNWSGLSFGQFEAQQGCPTVEAAARTDNRFAISTPTSCRVTRPLLLTALCAPAKLFWEIRSSLTLPTTSPSLSPIISNFSPRVATATCTKIPLRRKRREAWRALQCRASVGYASCSGILRFCSTSLPYDLKRGSFTRSRGLYRVPGLGRRQGW